MVGRQRTLGFPQVWRRFDKTLKDGTVKKFKVQDVTEDLYEPVMNFMREFFLKEEPITLGSDVLKCDANIEQILKFWRYSVLNQNLSVVCLEDDDCGNQEIVGANFLLHSIRGFKFEKDYDEPIEILRILAEIDSLFDIFDAFGVNEYLGACGMAVNPKYRGMNIGHEILLCREPICKEMGLKVTETIFTAVGSQVLATKAGFKTLKEIKYDYLADKLKVKFPEGLYSMKVMTKVYD